MYFKLNGRNNYKTNPHLHCCRRVESNRNGEQRNSQDRQGTFTAMYNSANYETLMSKYSELSEKLKQLQAALGIKAKPFPEISFKKFVVHKPASRDSETPIKQGIRDLPVFNLANPLQLRQKHRISNSRSLYHSK
jgi:hypothetical protein